MKTARPATTKNRLIDHNHLNTWKLEPCDTHLWRHKSLKKSSTDDMVIISKREYRRLNILQGILLIILLGVMPGLVMANDYVDMGEVGSGTLFIRSASGVLQQALLMSSEVEFDISGLVARARVKQYFKNDSQQWMEGVYVFPLPENAAVDRLRMHIGERIVEGVIKEKQQAKKIYQQARAAGKRTALVEQERPNMFTSSVANIGPGETIIVEIAYQQTLSYEHGRFSMRFPMTITPRYIPGKPIVNSATQLVTSGSGWAKDTDKVPDASRITPPVKLNSGKLQNPISIAVNLDAGFPLAKVNSLYHDINVDRLQTTYQISLQKGQVSMDRDFELVWQPAVGAEPKAAFFKQNVNHEDYGLIMLMPPSVDQALVEAQKALPREVIFIIDTSGSMAGASITQAQQALLMALQSLSPNDRFNIIEFNSVTKKVFSQAVFADAQSINMAAQYVKNLQANGGTEMAPALRAALQGAALENYVRQVVFMTDGSVGNEQALFNLIEQQLNNSRLFTVGIGSAPNSYFMRKAAEFGRGSYTYISKPDEVAARMQELFSRLQTPVLSNLKLEWAGDDEPEVWPKRLPDLYKAQPLIITAKLTDDNDQLTLTGDVAGKQWQTKLKLEGAKDREGVASLWARKKIAALMDEQVRGADKDSTREAIIKIALNHQLVSKYTSLVAVDPIQARAKQDALHKTNVANVLPHGSQQNIQGYGFPQGATPSRLHLLLGMLSLLMMMTLVVVKRRYDSE